MASLGVMGVGSMIFPILVSFVLKENQFMWFLVMLGIAIFSALTIYLQFRFTRERVTEELQKKEIEENKKETASIGAQLKAVTGEKTWWIIIVFYLFFQWSGALKNGSMTFFCKWVPDNTFFGLADAWGASQSLPGILGAIPMAIAATFVVPVANRFGKRIVVFAGLILGVAGGLPGQAGARAMLNVLSGAVCPGGKLAETFPLVCSDVPSSRYFPGRELTSEYREGIYVGYRGFTSVKKQVLFPFGFGMSYTKFRYDRLTIDSDRVGFEITNCGDCAGAEVAQLYVSLPGARVFRPTLELKGFARVHLQPGERKRVTLPLEDKAFRYFNCKTGRFESEEGDYTLSVGADCEDIRLTGTLHVRGTNAPNPCEGVAMRSYAEHRPDSVTEEEFRNLLGHELPRAYWDTAAPLGENDMVAQMYYAKSPLARLVCRILAKMYRKSIARGKPNLNLLFICNIPFRGMGKMMNGMVSMKMVEDILLIANGHFFRGFGRLVKDFFHRPRLQPNPADEESA